MISVVIPVYNAQDFVESAVDSILAQSYQAFELILIDDGSSDRSRDLLLELAKRDSRIKLVLQENQGLIKTLNSAVANISGEWVARMDADDIAEPSRLQTQLRYAEKHGLDLLGTGHRCMGESNKLFVPNSDHTDICTKLFLWTNPFSHPTVMAKTALMKRFSYPEWAVGAEDMALWMDLVSAAPDEGFRFGNVEQPLLNYRVHSQQVSRRMEKQQRETVRKVVQSAIQSLDIGAKDDELSLHFDAWRGDTREWHGNEISAYERFLERLAVALKGRYGNSDAVFRYWRRHAKRIGRHASVAPTPDLRQMGAKWSARLQSKFRL